METYIVRIYRAELGEDGSGKAHGVVEVVGEEKKYFSRVEELPAIFRAFYQVDKIN